MGFWDNLSGIVDTVGGAVDTISSAAGSVIDIKNQIDSLTGSDAPTVDLASILGKYAGTGGGFGGGGGTWQNAGTNAYPKVWTETEPNGTVIHWKQRTANSPPEIMFVDPGAAELAETRAGGVDPILLGAGAVALVLLLK